MKVPSMPIAYKNPEAIRKTNPRLFLSISYDAVKSHQPATWVAGKGTTPNDLWPNSSNTIPSKEKGTGFQECVMFSLFLSTDTITLLDLC